MTQKLCLLLCTLLIFLTGCNQNTAKHPSTTGFYFDTVITFTLYDERSTSEASDILNQCMLLAEHYENLLSPNVKGSDVWNMNHSQGKPITVDPDTLSVLTSALNYAELSDGLVDPTVGTLSSLWNFGSSNQGIVPTDSQITEALSHINYHAVKIDGNQVTLTDPSAKIELGFIAKGFIADKFRDYLVSRDVKAATVNLGGNVITIGSHLDGTPFKIGIQKPFSQTGVSLFSVDSIDSSVVSSGTYERYFEKDGVLYHHILSTETGYPSDSGLSQVTIICNSSTECDALSTLCFVLGYEKSVSLLQNFPEVQAAFITADGDILYYNF